MDLELWRKVKKQQRLTIAEIANRANLPKGSVQNIFAGYVPSPRIDTVEAIERALGLRGNHVRFEASNVYDAGALVIYEELGTVKAGFGRLVCEIPTGKKIEIPASMISGGNKDDYFILRVSGNSMYPRLLDGDTILCQRCESVDSGTVAVVLYDGDEATVKKVNYAPKGDWLELIPFNPEYPTKRIEGIDLEQCRILGKVTKLIRDKI